VVKEVEKWILRYLEGRPDDWKWVKGLKVFTKEETIRLFKKDRKFRKLFVKMVLETAVDLFKRAVEKGEE